MPRAALACLTALALVSPTLAQDRLPRNARYPKWISDYSVGQKLAREGGKPLFVVLRCEP